MRLARPCGLSMTAISSRSASNAASRVGHGSCRCCASTSQVDAESLSATSSSSTSEPARNVRSKSVVVSRSSESATADRPDSLRLSPCSLSNSASRRLFFTMCPRFSSNCTKCSRGIAYNTSSEATSPVRSGAGRMVPPHSAWVLKYVIGVLEWCSVTSFKTSSGTSFLNNASDTAVKTGELCSVTSMSCSRYHAVGAESKSCCCSLIVGGSRGLRIDRTSTGRIAKRSSFSWRIAVSWGISHMNMSLTYMRMSFWIYRALLTFLRSCVCTASSAICQKSRSRQHTCVKKTDDSCNTLWNNGSFQKLLSRSFRKISSDVACT
mmetsp:Transcript_82992/g.224877  ORF Transcript_82992/g.224877 Transcript_82992/m.224877 type:complete len:322 (+) Transcript_82992:199-1164(+)